MILSVIVIICFTIIVTLKSQYCPTLLHVCDYVVFSACHVLVGLDYMYMYVFMIVSWYVGLLHA